MKTAKEIFEDMGYEKYGETTTNIVYKNQEHYYFIKFNLTYKSIMVHKPRTTFNLMNMQELQAINKQVEELGWLDAKD